MVVAALALWKLRIVMALLFFAVTLAASMRPGVDRLAARKVPRSLGVLLHYLALVGLVGLFLWFVVPHLISGCGISRRAASSSTRP